MKKLPDNHSTFSISSSFGSRIGRFYEPLHSAHQNAPPPSPDFTYHLLFASHTLLSLFTTANKKITRFPLNCCQKFDRLYRSLSVSIVNLININLVVISLTFYISPYFPSLTSFSAFIRLFLPLFNAISVPFIHNKQFYRH